MGHGLADGAGEAGQLVLGNGSVPGCGRLFEKLHFLCGLCPLDFQRLHLVGHIRIIALNQAICHQLQQAGNFAADLGLALSGNGQFAGALNLRVSGLRNVGLQNCLQPLRCEQAVREMVKHQAIPKAVRQPWRGDDDGSGAGGTAPAPPTLTSVGRSRRQWAAKDASHLEEELHRRAAAARDVAEKALSARGDQEAKDLRDLITTQRNRVVEEFAKPEDLQGELDLNGELASEAARRRRDRMHWQRKVADLETQLQGEPERLREGLHHHHQADLRQRFE